MKRIIRGASRLFGIASALALGCGLLAGAPALADDILHADFPEGDGGSHQERFSKHNLDYGTLGWAEYGLYPGRYGFSLRWHPGYGYGKYALGVGADGGYPFYAGPGYPHEPPHLNRCGPEAPYVYFESPEFPIFGDTNFYQQVGGLTVTDPVVSIGEPGDFGYVGAHGERNPGADFGSFTGAIPYPETYFAPFATATAPTTASPPSSGEAKPSTPPANSSDNPPIGPSAYQILRSFGVNEQPVVEPGGRRGTQVIDVMPGSPADVAGIHPGDVIHSVNGYLTVDRGNLAWVIAVAAPKKLLKLSVRSALDDEDRTITANLASRPANTGRPAILPAVGNGPPPAMR